MILVDTSIWIDHLRASDSDLIRLLNDGGVLTHPCVIGELALGSLKNREAILRALQCLPHAPSASHDEVLYLIEREALHGAGIGYIDAQLLAALKLLPGSRLWTRDKRLQTVATRLALAANITH